MLADPRNGAIMVLHVIARRATDSLLRRASGEAFPPLVGAAAFGATLTQTVPTEWLLVACVAARGKNWLALALWAASGAGAAAVVLYLGFHHLGWIPLAARYPDLAASRAWTAAAAWLERYGVAAIFAVMALPLPVPKLPVLAAAGLQRLPIAEVAAAILTGKASKYGAYAFLAARFSGFAWRMIGPTGPASPAAATGQGASRATSGSNAS